MGLGEMTTPPPPSTYPPEIQNIKNKCLFLNLADTDLMCVIKTEFWKMGKLEPLNLYFLKLVAFPTAWMSQIFFFKISQNMMKDVQRRIK